MASAREIIYKGSRIGNVLDSLIRGASSLKDEKSQTRDNIKELQTSLSVVRKTDSVRKDKYSSALLAAFDQDLIWLNNKIESVMETAENES